MEQENTISRRSRFLSLAGEVLLFLVIAFSLNAAVNIALADGALWRLLGDRLAHKPVYTVERQLFAAMDQRQWKNLVIGEEAFIARARAHHPGGGDTFYLTLPSLRLRNIGDTLSAFQRHYRAEAVYVQNTPILWNNALRNDTRVKTPRWTHATAPEETPASEGLLTTIDPARWNLFFTTLGEWAAVPPEPGQPHQLESLKQAVFDPRPKREFGYMKKPLALLIEQKTPLYWVDDPAVIPRATNPELRDAYRRAFTDGAAIAPHGTAITESTMSQQL